VLGIHHPVNTVALARPWADFSILGELTKISKVSVKSLEWGIRIGPTVSMSVARGRLQVVCLMLAVGWARWWWGEVG
jgi:hypothetical protein